MNKMSDRPRINLVGQDGNIFNVLSIAKKAYKNHYGNVDGWEEILEEIISDDYDHALRTVMKYFDVH